MKFKTIKGKKQDELKAIKEVLIEKGIITEQEIKNKKVKNE